MPSYGLGAGDTEIRQALTLGLILGAEADKETEGAAGAPRLSGFLGKRHP